MRSTVSAALAAILIGLTGCGSSPDDEGGSGGGGGGGGFSRLSSEVDLTYLCDDFAMAIVVNPRQIARSSLLATLPQDELLEEMIKDMQFDPRDIGRLTVFVADGSKSREAARASTGVIFQFGKSVDAEEVLRKMLGDDVTEGTFEGKDYLRRGNSEISAEYRSEVPVMTGYLADDRTIVFAEETRLKRMLSVKRAAGPLADRLRDVEPSKDVTMVVCLDSLRGAIKEASGEISRGMPPFLAPLLKAPDLVETATLTLDLSGNTLVEIVLEAQDAKSAEELEPILSTGLGFVRKFYPDARAEIIENAGPVVTEEMLELADDVVKGISVEKKGDRVVVQLKRPQALDDLPRMLKPAMAKARRQAKRTNNLKLIGLSLHHYHTSHGRLPPVYTADADGKPLLSWRVLILPYLEEKALYDQFHLDEPWDSSHNRPLAETVVDIYQNKKADPGYTSMMVFTGEGSPWNAGRGIGFESIRDGTSNTIAIVEAGADVAVPWTKPEDLPFDENDPRSAMGNPPRDGFSVAFFDGSVRTIPKNIDLKTLRRLIMHDDGQVVDSSKFK
ncbi:MAG: DUF1559 domain-containing protein [Planctomycetes bacterium]|nr:DUF1559 domain-containing protein [Planctomycetota bacterium]